MIDENVQLVIAAVAIVASTIGLIISIILTSKIDHDKKMRELARKNDPRYRE